MVTRCRKWSAHICWRPSLVLAGPLISAENLPWKVVSIDTRVLTLLAGGGRAAPENLVRGCGWLPWGGRCRFVAVLGAGVRACGLCPGFAGAGGRYPPCGCGSRARRADLASGGGQGWEDGRGLPVRPGLLWDASPFLTLVPGP